MESLRKAFGFSKERDEREGDAFDRDLQAQLRERRRLEHEENVRAKEEARRKEERRREKERRRAEKERK